MNEIDPTAHPDPAVSRATWVIGVAAALVLGMAIGVATTEAGTSRVSTGVPCEPWTPPAKTVDMPTGR